MSSRSTGCVAIVLVTILAACARRTDDARTVHQGPEASPAQTAAALPADTDLVRGVGVPTFSDDTASTQYGKHETPRRIASPECRPRGIALCIADTARILFSVECCAADERQTKWLVFAARDDSLQLFLEPAGGAFVRMSPHNAAGAGTETSQGLDASWMRARFPATGTYVVTAGIEADSSVPYELRVASVLATGASQPMGTAATLTLSGPPDALIAVAPLAMRLPEDSSELRRFAVPSGEYRVLLVRDTLYEACRIPCRRRERFVLREGQVATISP